MLQIISLYFHYFKNDPVHNSEGGIDLVAKLLNDSTSSFIIKHYRADLPELIFLATDHVLSSEADRKRKISDSSWKTCQVQ